MPGLFATLGSFGSRIITTIRQTGRSIAEAIGLAPKQARGIEPSVVTREFAQAARLTERESLVATLPRDQVIPDYLHVQSDIPFKRPYAYTVTLNGRAVAGRIGAGGVHIGGRFVRDTVNLTFNRQMSIAEIEEIVLRRFGAGGEYPLLIIDRMSITAAMIR